MANNSWTIPTRTGSTVTHFQLPPYEFHWATRQVRVVVSFRQLHCKDNTIYVFLFWELHGLSPNFHIHVSVSDLYIPRIGPHNFLAAEYKDRSWKYIKLSQTFECRNWETEHYNSVLEITVSFLGIYKWEPDIYIGFSPALHLQCGDTA
jgi:hypothetical protein